MNNLYAVAMCYQVGQRVKLAVAVVGACGAYEAKEIASRELRETDGYTGEISCQVTTVTIDAMLSVLETMVR